MNNSHCAAVAVRVSDLYLHGLIKSQSARYLFRARPEGLLFLGSIDSMQAHLERSSIDEHSDRVAVGDADRSAPKFRASRGSEHQQQSTKNTGHGITDSRACCQQWLNPGCAMR